MWVQEALSELAREKEGLRETLLMAGAEAVSECVKQTEWDPCACGERGSVTLCVW